MYKRQDTNLADIDRIEVIRGPGATLWGANAVNGVINIVTRKAQDSLGSELNLSGGSELRAAGSPQHNQNCRITCLPNI